MLYSTLRFLCLLLLLAGAFGASGKVATPLPEARTLEFVENRGQWDAHARYMAELPSGRLFLTNTGFTFALVDPQALHAHYEQSHTNATSSALPDKLRAHAYSVTFEGANAKPKLTGVEATPGTRNYFRGSDAKQWADGAQGFHEVTYGDVYPGVGVHLYENQEKLEYDFTVAAGAKPSAIRLRYTGADQLGLDNGRLVIRTSVGTVTEQAPLAWQQVGERRIAVPCEFVLSKNVISFKLGTYNQKLPLVIDPTIVFSSFTGSTADNWGFTATYDAQGNLYSGGIVFGIGYPATTGAYDVSFNGIIDMAIIKYNPSVNGAASRLYATYLGGNQADAPHSMVVNARNELLILGSTSSRDYPVTSSAYQSAFGGGIAVSGSFLNGIPYTNGSDLVVTCLSSDGQKLLSSTYLGGSNNDGLVQASATTSSPLVRNYGDQFRGDILTDANNNVYIASATASANFPIVNGFQRTLGGLTDGVVCKLTPNLSQLTWSTYLGGNQYDATYSLQLAANGEVFVCGGTTSTNFAFSTDGYQPKAQGDVDGYVARIRPDGQGLIRASYVGTSKSDQAYFIQLDGDGDVYLLGQSKGVMPITAGTYNVRTSGQYILKFDADLKNVLLGTTIGVRSTNSESAISFSPTAFLVDDCERIYVCGWGGGPNTIGPYYNGTTDGLATTSDGLQRTTDGEDFYLAELSPGAATLEYATFLGGSGVNEHVDGGTSRFDKRGYVYHAVCGGCQGRQAFPFPPGVNTYSTRNGSTNCNNAAFKFDFGARIADPGPRRYICLSAGPVTLGGTPAGGVWQGPGVTAAPGGGYLFTPSVAKVGSSILTYTAAATGTCLTTRSVRYIVMPEPVMTFALPPEVCRNSAALTLTATPSPGGTFSGPGVTGNVFDPARAGVGQHTITYSLTDTLGCGAVSRTIIVSAPPVVAAGPDSTLCADQIKAFRLRGATPAGGTWSGTGVSADGLFTPPNTNGRGAVISLKYTYGKTGCDMSATKTITLAPVSSSSVSLNVPECTAAPQYTGLAPLTIQFQPSLMGGTYSWDFGDNTPIATEAAPTHEFTKPGTYKVQLTARYAGCVVVTQFAPVEVGAVFVPNIITPNGDGKNDQFMPTFSCQPATLKVFSRWGAKVYETDDYRNDWRGDNLADGVYYYHLRDTEGRWVKGWVEVKR
ncbi:DUF7948 domain-containing protein [Hymenobacter jejuensis]|uniref:PKD domain-containing protein n=1 Tax=Hymenobacter jejuensis TaxID=2502781 RepID=A0A5B7ZZI8_9BACT|nr:gliding motility-associated C-terminal domain-containing protein [Hymenobacter jejuensis]QDA60624.1 PKD domain-containing protein [Hymenobacter jejuensis]